MQEDRRAPFALIVEDHPLVADSLVACIHSCNRELKVDSAESLGAALHILAQRTSPVLIVTDLNLTDANGTEAVRRLRQAAPQSPLLVFTAFDDPQLRSEAREFGAIDYLIKTSSIETLRQKIAAVIGGLEQETPAAPGRAARVNALLTPKQIAVLEELTAGRSNKEIAARLNISDETVSSHVKAILGRLAVRNRTEAVVRYLQIINDRHDRSNH